MVIVRDFNRPPKDVVAGFADHSAADVHEAMGKKNAMASTIGHVGGPKNVYGPACTVRVPPGDNMMVHAGVEYAHPGDVLIVAAESDHAATWGELATQNAQMQGLAGLVSNGNVRDIAYLSNSDLPVFAAAISQAGAVKETPGSVNVPVAVGGVTVSPGDIIVGDADGVTVVPRGDAHRVLEATEAKVKHEEYLRRQIREGRTLYELLNIDEKIADRDVRIVDSLNDL
ncbi:4-carboxy-4-hydroxy-2-oxoadipate aldolase/oxaloacetate decarboxylase [Halegenticoccus tardaugens]|uniref:4-carboxy-4-hydroxy-2-oxoadipate aldolase/oxaloacetate decarboxylase n=1 Tax=Halegenticoccus tardaugens TaxID=2071624 RepID=UPI001E3C2151|nr:4-carboxy-4-hydroxy-2-oxoadipate aldolase/oxaloacetate decarboxylase [Halegenticoccus tardaugens]